jgi:hypothetical protein
MAKLPGKRRCKLNSKRPLRLGQLFLNQLLRKEKKLTINLSKAKSTKMIIIHFSKAFFETVIQ